MPRPSAQENARAIDQEGINLLSLPQLKEITPQSVLDGIHPLPALIRQIKYDAFYGLEEHCKIPAGFQKCRLEIEFKNIGNISDAEASELARSTTGAIINPFPIHYDTIALFKKILNAEDPFCERGNPLKPLCGAYLYGPTGCGKTHLMAAFARELRTILDKKLEGIFSGVDSLVNSYYKEYLKAIESGAPVNTGQLTRWNISDEGDGSKQEREAVNPGDRFVAKCTELRSRMLNFHLKPTDILYIGFDALCGIYEDRELRQQSIDIIERSPIVFVDDLFIDPKRPERLAIAQTLIENRLANDKIATYITSNVSTEELIKGQSVINSRLRSRCEELYIPLDFSEVPDWRVSMRARKNKHLLSVIRQESDHQIANDQSQALQVGLGDSWGKRITKD